jgi:hypothetical protein
VSALCIAVDTRAGAHFVSFLIATRICFEEFYLV